MNPIIAAANIVQTIQTTQTREISVLKPTIIMFTKIKSGVKSNIIPDKVSLEGMMRYLYKGEEENEEKLEKRFERIVEAICKAYRTKYKLKFYNENQPVINDLNMTKLARSNYVHQNPRFDSDEDTMSIEVEMYDRSELEFFNK